jgi:transposase
MTLLSHAPPDFAQVEMTPALQPLDAPDDKNSTPVRPPRPAGLIEIVLSGGVTLRVDAEVDAAALVRVLTALDQR